MSSLEEKVLSSEEIDCRLERIPARLTGVEKRFLWESVYGLLPGSVYVEIGTELGGSVRVVAEANSAITIFTLDPENAVKERQDVLRQLLRHFLDRVNFLPYKSCEEGDGHTNLALHKICTILDWVDPQFDLVFIDGDHSPEVVAEDINAYFPTVKPGGILCGHDCHRYDPRRTSMLKTVTDIFAKKRVSVHFLDRIWYVIVPLER